MVPGGRRDLEVPSASRMVLAAAGVGKSVVARVRTIAPEVMTLPSSGSLRSAVDLRNGTFGGWCGIVDRVGVEGQCVVVRGHRKGSSRVEIDRFVSDGELSMSEGKVRTRKATQAGVKVGVQIKIVCDVLIVRGIACETASKAWIASREVGIVYSRRG
jgi:hypothetical protein